MSEYYNADDVKELILACEYRLTLAKERNAEGHVDHHETIVNSRELCTRLEGLPTIETDEDAIDRKRLLRYIADMQLGIGLIDEQKPTVLGETVCDWIFDEVKEFPSVAPSRPTGKWIKNDSFECDQCHHKMIVGDGAYNYCPSCGADMRGEDNEG